jgi:WXG100 family type VII secretion target
VVNVSVDAPRAVNTSHAVGGDAEELRAELSSLSREWDAVLAGWSGVAASSYAARWEEWHYGATRLVETLARSSELLGQAAVAYDEQEAASARAMASVPAEIGR